MAKVKIMECGTNSDRKAEIFVTTNDLGLEINGKLYRFQINKDNSLTVALINGVDAKITTAHGNYPAVKLIHK